jgi:hypothetical protein
MPSVKPFTLQKECSEKPSLSTTLPTSKPGQGPSLNGQTSNSTGQTEKSSTPTSLRKPGSSASNSSQDKPRSRPGPATSSDVRSRTGNAVGTGRNGSSQTGRSTSALPPSSDPSMTTPSFLEACRRQIVVPMLEGKTLAEVASELGTSPFFVKKCLAVMLHDLQQGGSE